MRWLKEGLFSAREPPRSPDASQVNEVYVLLAVPWEEPFIRKGLRRKLKPGHETRFAPSPPFRRLCRGIVASSEAR